MTPQLRFSKDFDSFTVEPDHLDVVYGEKTFRLAYPINGERKFSVEAWGNTKILLPEMLLECYNRDISHGIPVNVEAGFEDVLILGRFVEKLASIAGYQQVRVDEDNLSANTSCGSEYEDEIDGEIDCLCWQSKAKKVNLHRPRPILMFVEDKVLPLGFSFPGGSAGYFEITQTPGDTHYRFAYMPGVNRKYELEPEDFDRRATRRATYLMHNVMLQSPPKPNNQRVFKLRNGRRRVAVSPFVNLAEVDVFVDLGVFSDDVFRGGIRKDNFTPI